MDPFEKLESPHLIALGFPPKEADIAFASIDSSGTPGELNKLVFKEYAYSTADLPDAGRLRSGFSLVSSDKRKPIILIVTVSNEAPTAKNLERNLFDALLEFRSWFQGKKVWIPLMGCGAGGLTPEQSYSITVAAINKALERGLFETEIILSIPPDTKGKAFFSILEASRNFSSGSVNYFLAGSVWHGNQDQSPRFFEEGTWENGYEEKFTEVVNSAKQGDLVFLKSTFAANEISYLRIKAVGKVEANLNTGTDLKVAWDLKLSEPVDIPGLGKYRRTFARIMPDDLATIVDAIGTQKLEKAGLLPKTKEGTQLDDATDLDVPGSLIQNRLHKVSLNNDGARTEKDLLGFENDIRAFACLIALKQLTPPLAIALFGKWGSGKSFFMHNLQKRIELLSRKQGFEITDEAAMNSATEDEPFCKGIVHITFNAWSYIDANLWASLVANIFEKLDEYISEQTVGAEEKRKVREVLNRNLSILNEEKNKIQGEKKKLLAEKQDLIKGLENIEKEKNELLKKAAKQNYEALYKEVQSEFPLPEHLKAELVKYGLDDTTLKALSPDTIFSETKSWFRFATNLTHFNWLQIGVMILGGIILLLSVFIPEVLFNQSIGYLKAITASSIGIIGPTLYRFVKSFNQFKKVYERVKTYKENFNHAFQEAVAEHEKKLATIEGELRRANNELHYKTHKLTDLNEEIALLEHELGNSVTGKAFFDFIRNKSKDAQYSRSLSIVSTIRRDFETLSELFRDFNTNDTSPGDEKSQVRKQDAKELQNNLSKPLDRIVLYVDDLDRCPEERVIEVLEAVNLLMAYPLFVVVVGVDPRWVKNALLKKYAFQFTGQLGNGTDIQKHGVQPIHVTDYLEKIFQIPFHLSDPGDEGSIKLLTDIFAGQIQSQERQEAQREVSPDDDPDVVIPGKDGSQTLIFIKKPEAPNKIEKPTSIRPEDLKISSLELSDLTSLAWLIGTNPRSLKRYANIYRIVRAHENLSYGQNTQRQDFLAVLFILGLGIGKYKSIAKDFFAACSSHSELNLGGLLDSLNGESDQTLVQQLRERSVPDMLAETKGSEFSRYIPFVRRFCFEHIP